MATKRKTGILLTEGELRKRYPDSGKASVINVEDDENEGILKLPSEVITINHQLGGGLAYGKVHENFGDESTGKTALAKNFGKVAQSLGGVVLWNDAECCWDSKWAKNNGLDLEKIELFKFENRIEIISDWISDMGVYWRSKLTNNEPILWVIDSIAVLEVLEAMETAQLDTKAEMGRRSFKMGEMLRKRTSLLARYGIIALFINQLRQKVGAKMFEDPDTTPMSQPMKYYAALRFGLHRGKRIKSNGDTGKWIGNEVYVRIKKNKSSAPENNIKARVFFKKHEDYNIGYDKYFGMEELLVDQGILKRKQGKFFYKKELVAKNDKALLKLIQSDQKFRKKMIEKLGVNTPSKLRARLESINKNLYPVKVKSKKDEEKNEE